MGSENFTENSEQYLVKTAKYFVWILGLETIFKLARSRFQTYQSSFEPKVKIDSWMKLKIVGERHIMIQD